MSNWNRITKPAGDFAGGQNSYIFLLFRTGFLALMLLIQQHSDFFPEKLASLGLWLSPLLKLLPNGMRSFFFLSTESNGAFSQIILLLPCRVPSILTLTSTGFSILPDDFLRQSLVLSMC